MKLLDIQGAIGTAILLLSLPCDALHQHTSRNLELLGKRHGHWRLHERATSRTEEGNDTVEGDELKKRGSCSFPSNAGLVAVTPGSSNAGWAMSPDQPCLAGSYCPYACPPGKVMQQWSPDATSYTYPESMVCLRADAIRCIANSSRLGVCIVITMEPLASHFPRKSIAWMEQTQLAPRTNARAQSHFAKLCYPETRQC